MTRRALLLLAAAVATVATAAAATEVEIRVQDYSFADGPTERQMIAIEAQDIKGSELLTATAKQQKQQQAAGAADRRKSASADPEPKAPRPTIPSPARKKVKQLQPPRAAQSAFTAAAIVELSSQEQVVVLGVVFCGLCFAALVLVAVGNLARFGWHYAQEQRALRRLFREDHAGRLSVAIDAFPATSSLLIRKIAVTRLQHLEFVSAVTDLNVQLSTLSFDEDTLELRGLPRRADAKTAMTLLEALDALAQLRTQGELLAAELLQVAGCVPPQWKHYVDTHAWLKKHDECLQKLHAHSSRVQQLATCISELLMSKLHDGEALEKGTFVHLLAALRHSSTPDDGSMRLLGSNGSAGAGASSLRSGSASSKDEFSFFVKAFDELNEQNHVKQELRRAMLSYNNTVIAATTKVEISTVAEAPAPHDDDAANGSRQQNGAATKHEHDKVLLTRKLEKFVDRAEVLGMTHFEEVERAQYALENARRETFCAAVFNKDARELENVESLALNFVSMGAKRKDAVLKAGEILANRSNTMLLVTSLRGMFDELRKHDIMKMNERRHRDAAKLADKRERMNEKFRLKQQLVAEKLELQRLAQQKKEEDERQRRAQQEADERRRRVSAERRAFVWLVTKVDVLVVLLVMGLVFFESLRQLAFIKPVCAPDDTRFSGVLSLFGGATSSLAVLGCQVAYGAKMAALLLLASFALFLLSQLNLLVVVLPAAAAVVLYHVRAEWMNMVVRVPLLAVVYGFNSSFLYLLNRAEEEEAAAPAAAQQQVRGEQRAGGASGRSKTRVVLAYLVFPLLSLALSVAVGVGIACDDPQQCASTAFRIAAPVVSGLARLAREAYGL